MLKQIAAVACVMGLATGAFAQSTTPSTTAPGSTGATAGKTAAECTTNWKAIDRNNDGRADKAELDAHKAMVPTSVSTATTVTQSEYLSACQSGGTAAPK